MNNQAKTRPFVAILSLLLLASAVGCVSTEKRYKKGVELESEGRLEEAAQRYVAVLAKEPGPGGRAPEAGRGGRRAGG